MDNSRLLIYWILAAPLFAVVLAFVLLLIPQSIKEKLHYKQSHLSWVTRLIAAISLISAILLAAQTTDEPYTAKLFIVDLYLDALSIYFIVIVNIVAFFASWYTANFLAHDAKFNPMYHQPEIFHLLFNLFHLTMLLVPMVDNLIILWMAIELTTLASTLLVRYSRTRASIEASWKYIIITTVGIIFALLGTIILALAVNNGLPQDTAGNNYDLMNWSFLSNKENASQLAPSYLLFAFFLIMIGYGTKAGFAPMHTWLPDGHGEAPFPVSALLSGVLLKSALYAILRFYTIVNLNDKIPDDLIHWLFMGIGLLSLLIATPFIVKTNKFKRVLAYHSLEHMGIIAFGIGIGTELALFGALLHALNHALTKALMFLVYGKITQNYEKENGGPLSDQQITGVLKKDRPFGFILLLGGLGLVGSPPANIFMSELIILWAAISKFINLNDKPQAWLIGFSVIIFVGTLATIFAGLVGHISRVLLGSSKTTQSKTGPLQIWAYIIPSLLLFVILIFGVWIPNWPIDFPNLLNQSIKIIMGSN